MSKTVQVFTEKSKAIAFIAYDLRPYGGGTIKARVVNGEQVFKVEMPDTPYCLYCEHIRKGRIN